MWRLDVGHDEGGRRHGGCQWNVGEGWGVLALTGGENRAPEGPDDKGEEGAMAIV